MIVKDSSNVTRADLGGVTGTNATITAALTTGDYTFTVQGTNAGTEGPVSDPFAFSITLPYSTPATPLLVWPTNNSTSVNPAGLTLKWKDTGTVGATTDTRSTNYRLSVRLSADLFCVEFPTNTFDPACASQRFRSRTTRRQHRKQEQANQNSD